MTLYLSAVWTQSGESGNTIKIKCSGTPDERANIFSVPTTSEAECISQCSVSDKMLLLLLSKPPQRRHKWSGSPRLWLTPPQTKSPGGISEAMRYGIDSPSGLRPRLNGNAAKARRRCQNALINLYILKLPFLQQSLLPNLRLFP